MDGEFTMRINNFEEYAKYKKRLNWWDRIISCCDKRKNDGNNINWELNTDGKMTIYLFKGTTIELCLKDDGIFYVCVTYHIKGEFYSNYEIYAFHSSEFAENIYDEVTYAISLMNIDEDHNVVVTTLLRHLMKLELEYIEDNEEEL